MLMHGNIRLPGPVYIESGGVIVCRGDVRRVDPAMREMVDVWPADQQLGGRERLRGLHYQGWGLHSRETVELCRGVMSRPGAEVSLVYTHRGHRCQWKTPLLQSLLAMLGPGVRVHGLQVEQKHLPLDLVLFGVATLATCERCIIVKDNAIRVGTEEVVTASATQYLVLSRASGSWVIEEILMDEEGPDCPSTLAALSLDEFLADGDRGMDSLSLISRTAKGCLGVITLVRVGRKEGALESAAGANRLAGGTVASRSEHGGVGNA
jgi:hypothetical protein